MILIGDEYLDIQQGRCAGEVITSGLLAVLCTLNLLIIRSYNILVHSKQG